MIHFRPNLSRYSKNKKAQYTLYRGTAPKKYPYSGNEAANSKDSTKNLKNAINTVYSVIKRLSILYMESVLLLSPPGSKQITSRAFLYGAGLFDTPHHRPWRQSRPPAYDHLGVPAYIRFGGRRPAASLSEIL